MCTKPREPIYKKHTSVYQIIQQTACCQYNSWRKFRLHIMLLLLVLAFLSSHSRLCTSPYYSRGRTPGAHLTDSADTHFVLTKEAAPMASNQETSCYLCRHLQKTDPLHQQEGATHQCLICNNKYCRRHEYHHQTYCDHQQAMEERKARMKANVEGMAAGTSDERSHDREAGAISDATPASTALENATVPQSATRSSPGQSVTQLSEIQALQQPLAAPVAAPGYHYVAMDDGELEVWVELKKQLRERRTDP